VVHVFGHAVPLLDFRGMPDGIVMSLIATALFLLALGVLRRGRSQMALLVVALSSLPLTLLADPLVFEVLNKEATYIAARTVGLLAWAPLCAIAWGLGRLPKPDGGLLDAGALERKLATVLCGFGVFATAWMTVGGATHVFASPITDSNSFRFSDYMDVRTGPYGSHGARQVRDAFGIGWPTVGGFPQIVYQVAGMANVHPAAVPPGNTPAYFEQRGATEERDAMFQLCDPTTTDDQRRAVVDRYRLDYLVMDPAHVPATAYACRAILADTRDYSLTGQFGAVLVFKVQAH
jgi:hypothetical protein